jgi:hypothetical protein
MNNYDPEEFVKFSLTFFCNHGNAEEQGKAFALVQKYRAPEKELVVPTAPMRATVLQGLAKEIQALALFGDANPPAALHDQIDVIFGPALLQLRALANSLISEVFPRT